MRKTLALFAVAALAALAIYFGIHGHGYAGGTADPVCVTPDTISAEDQKALDALPDFAGFKSVVVVTMTGPTAQAFAGILAANDAPDYFKTADTIVVLNALPPAGSQPMSNRHVVAFKDGCEVGGGFIRAEFLAKMLGTPA